ncbi:MAG: hypothetical protein ACREM2_02605 [Vulcanimicrobiaceae bacterium]
MRKKAGVRREETMTRPGSLRFNAALADDERAAVARTLRPAGIAVARWAPCCGGAVAAVTLAEETERARAAAAAAGALLDVPPLVFLAVRTGRPLAALLGGPARAAGVLAFAPDGERLELALDARRTPLERFVELVDVALAGAARTIEPLLPLDDATLASFAGALLAEPSLDASRLIETQVALAYARAR